MLGREVPESPCTVFFKDIEWKALCCYVNKTPVPPEKPPSLSEAIYMVGGIGGHLGRKSDGSLVPKPSGVACNVWIRQQKCMLFLPNSSLLIHFSLAHDTRCASVSCVGKDHPLMGDPFVFRFLQGSSDFFLG